MDGLRFDEVDAMLYLDYGREPGQWKPNIYGTNENLAGTGILETSEFRCEKADPGSSYDRPGRWAVAGTYGQGGGRSSGFDYKWNQGWTRDFLEYLSKDPLERKNAHDQLTLSMVYAYCEHYILTLGTRDVGTLEKFMENLPEIQSRNLPR